MRPHQFIKITDITTELLKPGHPFYQPVLTGFDLDAVVGLHCVLKSPSSTEKSSFAVFQSNTEIVFESADARFQSECEIFSVEGRLIYKTSFLSQFSLSLKLLPVGAYIVVLKNGIEKFTQKLLVE